MYLGAASYHDAGSQIHNRQGVIVSCKCHAVSARTDCYANDRSRVIKPMQFASALRIPYAPGLVLTHSDNRMGI